MESMESFANNYFEYVGRLLNQLDKSKICSFIKEMEFARSSGNTVFIVGNGGFANTGYLHREPPSFQR